jgi:mono/diheme cytochrome c family protein
MTSDPTLPRARPTAGARVRRALALAAAGTAIVVAAAAAAGYVLSERRLARVYAVDDGWRAPPAGAADVARGRHLVEAVLGCAGCHAPDLGGSAMVDAPPMRIAPPNLTRGRGGVGALRTDAQLVRAVRHGLRADGTPLLLMPSDAYASLGDEDMAAVIAYVRSVPPVDREVGPTRLTPLGRALLAAGVLDELSAERIDHARPAPARAPADTVGAGRYLADVAGCTFCHAPSLGGREAFGPPGTPPPPAISRDALARWSEADFVRALRTGRRPDGRVLDEFMPWRHFARMTDAELHAIWRYIQASPPTRAAPAW